MNAGTQRPARHDPDLDVHRRPPSNPVDLEIGPDGDLFYVDFEGGTIHRVTYASGNQAPTAVIGATPAVRPVAAAGQLRRDRLDRPRRLGADLRLGSRRRRPVRRLDGREADRSRTRPPGTHTVRLRVTDAGLATGTASRTILVDDALPDAGHRHAGGRADLEGRRPDLVHRPRHRRPGRRPARERPVVVADHPALPVELPHPLDPDLDRRRGRLLRRARPRLPVVSRADPDGHRRVEPARPARRSASTRGRSTLTFQTNPTGLSLVVGTQSEAPAPFTRTVIVGSNQGVTAGGPQTFGGTTYVFGSWSDGGAATHTIVAPATATTYTATYVLAPPGTTSYLSDLAYTVTANGWGPVEKDKSNGEQAAGDGKPITLAGVVYAKGLGVHAASDIRYTMSACTSFTAKVGVDDEIASTRGSVVFQVYADGDQVAYDSGTMTGATATKAVSVNTTGKTALRLVVTVGRRRDRLRPRRLGRRQADLRRRHDRHDPADGDRRRRRPTARRASRPAPRRPRCSARRSTRRPSPRRRSASPTRRPRPRWRAPSATTARTGARPSPRPPPSRASQTYLVRVLGGPDGRRRPRRQPPRGRRHAGRSPRPRRTDTTPPTVTGFTPGQRRDEPVDHDRADRHVLRGDQPVHPDHHDLQPD